MFCFFPGQDRISFVVEKTVFEGSSHGILGNWVFINSSFFIWCVSGNLWYLFFVLNFNLFFVIENGKQMHATPRSHFNRLNQNRWMSSGTVVIFLDFITGSNCRCHIFRTKPLTSEKVVMRWWAVSLIIFED